MRKKEDIRFELNVDSLSLFTPHKRSEFEALKEVMEAISAVVYLLKAMEISINEEVYNRLDSKGKGFFRLKK